MAFVRIFSNQTGYIKRYSFLIRYGISGALGGLVQTLALYIWVSVLGLQTFYLWGVAVGFCFATLASFTLQKYWTFADRAHLHLPHRQLIIYVLVALGGLGLNTLLFHASKTVVEAMHVNFFHIWYLVVQVVIILIVAIFSFLVNYFVTFRAPKTSL